MYASTWKNVAWHPFGWFVIYKKRNCDQLIKLIKCVQSVSESVSFECAWKAEEQQSGYYNLVFWKIKTRVYGSWFSTNRDCLALQKMNQRRLLVATSPPKLQLFAWPKVKSRKSRRKKKLKKPKKITADVSYSMFQEFSKLQISWHNTTSSRPLESTWIYIIHSNDALKTNISLGSGF